MRYAMIMVGLALIVMTGAVSAATNETEIFSDSFQAPEISSDWTVHEGDWAIEDGALVNRTGGLIMETLATEGAVTNDKRSFPAGGAGPQERTTRQRGTEPIAV